MTWDARKKLKNGADRLAKAVIITFGPKAVMKYLKKWMVLRLINL